MKFLPTSVKAFFIRNWHLCFNRKQCVRLIVNYMFRYNDIIITGSENRLRCLGKGVFIIKKTSKHE